MWLRSRGGWLPGHGSEDPADAFGKLCTPGLPSRPGPLLRLQEAIVSHH